MVEFAMKKINKHISNLLDFDDYCDTSLKNSDKIDHFIKVKYEEIYEEPFSEEAMFLKFK